MPKKKKCVLTKETKESYYYKNYPAKYYIVRRWDYNGVAYAHYYPTKNGLCPRGFSSKRAAQKRIDRWGRMHGEKIVTGKQASKFEVPKRW